MNCLPFLYLFLPFCTMVKKRRAPYLILDIALSKLHPITSILNFETHLSQLIPQFPQFSFLRIVTNFCIHQFTKFPGGQSLKYLHELYEKMPKYLNKLCFFRKNSTCTPLIVKNKTAYKGSPVVLNHFLTGFMAFWVFLCHFWSKNSIFSIRM